MTPLSWDFESLVRALSSAHGVKQLALLALAAAIAWLIARIVHAKLPENLKPGLAKIGAGSAHRLLFPLLWLSLAWLASLLLAKYQTNQPTPIMRIAIPLIASYAAIRLVVYLLRHMMAPSARLKAAERVIGFTIWAIVALYLIGVIPEIIDTLDDQIIFKSGDKKISLWMMIGAALSAFVTVFIALAVSGLIEKRIMAIDRFDMSTRVVTSKTLRALALALGVLIALPLMGIPLTLLSVFGGALGVGLGLGLQKITSNFVSGFIILLDHSVRLGDLITVDNRHGVVQEIRARYTIIKGFDGTEVIVPNDSLITNAVIRHPYKNLLVPVKAELTIADAADVSRARDLIAKLAIVHQRVAVEPVPTVLIKQLTEKGVLLELTVHMADPENGQANLRSDLLETILHTLAENGIATALPPTNGVASATTHPHI
jgi:small-conductance mechanosensitive channel